MRAPIVVVTWEPCRIDEALDLAQQGFVAVSGHIVSEPAVAGKGLADQRKAARPAHRSQVLGDEAQLGSISLKVRQNAPRHAENPRRFARKDL